MSSGTEGLDSPDSNKIPDETQRQIDTCHQIMRAMTGVFLVAFGLIIVMTTFSTGPFVQTAGKGLYYLILLSGLVSLLTWGYRSRLEKRLSVPPVV